MPRRGRPGQGGSHPAHTRSTGRYRRLNDKAVEIRAAATLLTPAWEGVGTQADRNAHLVVVYTLAVVEALKRPMHNDAEVVNISIPGHHQGRGVNTRRRAVSEFQTPQRVT